MEAALGALVLAWLGIAALASGVARHYGEHEWPWFWASALAGPIAWVLLFMRIRALRERGSGPAHRPRLPRMIDFT